jgi:hypothetical protein
LSSSLFPLKHQVHDQEKTMKTLRKLASVLVLMLVLVVPSFAGQLEGPPCPQPVPGQLEGPPCQEIAPVNIGGPSNSSTATAADEAFTEIMTELLESMLSFY